MKFIDAIKSSTEYISDKFIKKSTGSYYTHQIVAEHLINKLVAIISPEKTRPVLKVVDPFAGDGRLIEWLIDSWSNLKLPRVTWEVHLWDINSESLNIADNKLNNLIKKGESIAYSIKLCDSFKHQRRIAEKFDLVITNPPWEVLKPDNRELESFSSHLKKEYILALREYDSFLITEFPKSQPKNKFAGWGTNLSRVGLELSHKICQDNGIVAIVLPASFFADEQSQELRTQILRENDLVDIGYFPAEAKLFENADVNSATLIYRKSLGVTPKLQVSVYNRERERIHSEEINPYSNLFFETNHIIPLTLNSQSIKILNKIAELKTTWRDLEENSENGLWAGREIDETNKASWLCKDGSGPKFIKGAMIDRYNIISAPSHFVNKENWIPQTSCQYERIAWRDVSRSTQKRRIIATIIPKNTVAGNSLNVAYFRNGDTQKLKVLLAIMSSTCFEFQLRCFLATGHISLSAIRKVYVPATNALLKFDELIKLTEQALSSFPEIEAKIEAYVAKKVYALSKDEFETVLQTFQKFTQEEKINILSEYNKLD